MVAAERTRPRTPGEPPSPVEVAGQVHQMALERVFARIFTVVTVILVLDFWLSASTVSGQSPRSMVADVLLSLLLTWRAIRALRRPPSQPDLYLLAACTAGLMLATRISAVPGSPFVDQAAYLLGVPAAAAWAVWSRRLVVPVPVLLIILSAGAWPSARQLAVEQSVTALATVTLGCVAARLMRAAARHADDDADRLSRELASQDAALTAEEAEQRAANAVHDDVLSVLRAVAAEVQSLPPSVLAAKAKLALSALARQVRAGSQGFASLESALRRQALRFAPELNVACEIEDDFDIPAAAAEALSGAVGEALRNVTMYAGVREATVTAHGAGPNGVEVTVRDDGAGFDPAQVGLASTGLRNSVRRRMQDAGGNAEVISSPGEGTTITLTWQPPVPPAAEAVDPLAWARRVTPSPALIFLGFMLPILLSSLILLCLNWHDQRWQPAPEAVFLGMLGLAALCARYLNKVRMTRQAALGLAAANTVLAAAGTLVIVPGTADAFAWWVAGDSGIVIAAIYFICGPVPGLATLAADLAALLAGLVVTGRAIAAGAWLGTLISPVIGTGLAVGLLAAFRDLARYTESQLAEYGERLRLRARAEAMSRVDSAALENARQVAGPVLDLVASGQAPDANLRMAAALANAALRDELLAPGFLTPGLAERVRAARTAAVGVTMDVPRRGDAALAETARELLAVALAGLDTGDDVILQVYPAVTGHPPLLLLRVRGARSSHAALRSSADEHGVLVSDLGGNELLLRLQPTPTCTAVTAA
jgi:signal transduction histidine kinase